MDHSPNGHIANGNAGHHVTKVNMAPEDESLITVGSCKTVDNEVRWSTRQKLLLMLTVVALVLSLASLLLSLWIHGKSSALPVTQESMCLPCDWLKTNPPGFSPDQQKLEKIPISQGKQCCAVNDEQLKTVLRSIIMEKGSSSEGGIKCNSHNKNCTSGGSEVAAAHLVLRSRQEHDGSRSSPQRPIRGWSAERSPAFAKDIRLVDDRLHIDRPGLYFIYSQISLLEYRDGADGGAGVADRVEHSIRRWQRYYSGEETLSRHTSVMGGGGMYVEHVSYVAGVFSLRFGDQIYVTLSSAHTQLAQPDPVSSYFGLYRL